MAETTDVRTAIAALEVGVARTGKPAGMPTLTPLRREVVATMPRTDAQEIRVIFAELKPGDVTPYHSHRFPVTVYVTEGTFTLELDGRDAVDIRQGEVFVEPAGVRMTGRNKSTDQKAGTLLFYVCEPGSPFADPVE